MKIKTETNIECEHDSFKKVNEMDRWCKDCGSFGTYRMYFPNGLCVEEITWDIPNCHKMSGTNGIDQKHSKIKTGFAKIPDIDISGYDGDMVKELKLAINWIKKNKNNIIKNIIDEKYAVEFIDDHEYPFWRMPNSILNKLSECELNFIDGEIEDSGFYDDIRKMIGNK